MLNLPLLGCELKRADFECVALNANELLLVEKRAELQELSSSVARLGGFEFDCAGDNVDLGDWTKLGLFGVSLAVFKHINYIG